MPGKKWTNDTIKQNALLYSSKTKWARNSPGAYEKARLMGIIDECCTHMDKLRHRWTDEEIIEDAKQYKNKWEWQKKSKSYTIAVTRKGLVEKCAKHMLPLQKTWTPELILSEAIKFNSKGEWSKKSQQSYIAALRHNILDSCCSHMTKLNKKWTKEELLLSASEHIYRIDWYKSDRKAYVAAKKMNVFDECVSHMNYKVSCMVEDIGIIYGYFFEDHTAYIGLTINLPLRQQSHKSRGPIYDKIQQGYSPQFKILEEHISNDILSEREIFYMDKMVKEGFTLLNKMKGGSRGTIKICRKSDSLIVKSAQLYDNINDWASNEHEMYVAAKRRRILKMCCMHMKQKVKIVWTNEKIITDALRFDSAKEWYKNSKNVYSCACRRKLLQICKDAIKNKRHG